MLYADWFYYIDETDTDKDGLSDELERILETDPLKEDTDGDGINDRIEIDQLRTDPTMSDSDQNGIEDGEEDSDEDGLKNKEELEIGTDPMNEDTDGDGLNDFEEINKTGEYKNSRNLTAGTLSTLDTSVVKNRKISWYAWEVVEGAKDSLFSLQLWEAESLGFDVVPFRSVVYGMTKIDEVIEFFIKKAEEMNLPQDGVVFKFQDTSYGKSLGYTSHHFRNCLLYTSDAADE